MVFPFATCAFTHEHNLVKKKKDRIEKERKQKIENSFSY